jgi:hypothetical protein
MYYGTYTIYDDEHIINLYDVSYNNNSYNDNSYNENDCLICLDNNIIISNNIYDKVTRIKNNTSIITTCSCNGSYHIKCLTQWLNRSQTCPICRKQILIYLDGLEENIVIDRFVSINYLIQCRQICINTYTICVRITNVIIYLLLWFLFIHYCVIIIYHKILHNP